MAVPLAPTDRLLAGGQRIGTLLRAPAVCPAEKLCVRWVAARDSRLHPPCAVSSGAEKTETSEIQVTESSEIQEREFSEILETESSEIQETDSSEIQETESSEIKGTDQ